MLPCVKHWQKFSHISQRKKPIGGALSVFDMPFYLWRIDFTSKYAFQIHQKFLLGFSHWHLLAQDGASQVFLQNEVGKLFLEEGVMGCNWEPGGNWPKPRTTQVSMTMLNPSALSSKHYLMQFTRIRPR